jgi:hypothetical protein
MQWATRSVVISSIIGVTLTVLMVTAACAEPAQFSPQGGRALQTYLETLSETHTADSAHWWGQGRDRNQMLLHTSPAGSKAPPTHIARPTGFGDMCVLKAL